jgi:hypothetical protein
MYVMYIHTYEDINVQNIKLEHLECEPYYYRTYMMPLIKSLRTTNTPKCFNNNILFCYM